jgi:hypothetical protein
MKDDLGHGGGTVFSRDQSGLECETRSDKDLCPSVVEAYFVLETNSESCVWIIKSRRRTAGNTRLGHLVLDVEGFDGDK